MFKKMAKVINYILSNNNKKTPCFHIWGDFTIHHKSGESTLTKAMKKRVG